MRVCAMLACLVGCAGLGGRALAQFRAATVTVQVEATSHLATTNGTNDRNQLGGAGAYPQFFGTVDADQAIGASGVQSRAQLGLEMSPTGLSANGSVFLSISAGEDFLSGSVDATSRIWVDFTIDSERDWTIDPGKAIGPDGSTQVSLMKGVTEVFTYRDTFTGATGRIGAGTYRLIMIATGSLSSTTGSNETGAMYSLGFALAEVKDCPADLNMDGVVDDFDFLIFLPAYDLLLCDDPAMPAGCPADLNHDGLVDDQDFLIFVVAYDELLCPA